MNNNGVVRSGLGAECDLTHYEIGRTVHVIESDGLYGAENVVLALFREALRERCFLPGLVMLRDQKVRSCLADVATEYGVSVAEVPIRKHQAVPDAVRAVHAIRAMCPSIIHTHGYKAALLGYVAHLFTRCPIVATCHLWYDGTQVGRSYRLLTSIERRLYRHYDHVVAVSDAIAARVTRDGVPERRVSVIPNGIFETDFALPRPGRNDEFVVLSVGRLSEQKGHIYLLQAVARLRRDGHNVRAVIVGEGALRGELEGAARDLGIDPHVSMPGFSSDVRPYLSAAHAFAMPSLDEGLPVAMLEAMAAGLPIVATPVGAIPKVLTNGSGGLLVPVGDAATLARAIRRLILEPDLGVTLAAQAKATLTARYTSKAMMLQYMSVYSSVLGSPAASLGKAAAS